MSNAYQKKSSASRFSRAATGALLAALFTVFSSVTFFSAPQTVSAQATSLRDIEYANVDGKRLLLDLHLPSGAGPFPVILWVHGGGWIGGNKNGGPAIRQSARGYAVASINYRLSFEAKFPAQIEDCKAAVRWLRANAARYNLDANRIGAWGSSAGGHLVALLGTSGGVTELEGGGAHLDFSSRVQAVVDWYGPTNLLKMQEQSLPCTPIDHNSPLSPESQLIGCAIQSCPEQTERANPIRYVTPDDPPFLLMHGTLDCLVPPQQSQDLHDALRALELSSTLFFLEGAGHGGGAFSSADNQARVDAFFDLHLKAPVTPKVLAAEIRGKKLIVTGEGFDAGATVYINNAPQKTVSDAESPTTRLIARKGGKQIAPQQVVSIQVKNANNTVSDEFLFQRL